MIYQAALTAGDTFGNYTSVSLSFMNLSPITIRSITVHFVYPTENTLTKSINLNGSKTIDLGIDPNTNSVTFYECEGLIGTKFNPSSTYHSFYINLYGGLYTHRSTTSSTTTYPGQIYLNNIYPADVDIEYEYDEVWEIDDYPSLKGLRYNKSPFSGWESPKPLNVWKIDSNNDGYPWTWGYSEMPAGTANIYCKTYNGLVPLTAFYKTKTGTVPLTYMGTK